ncbi:MAG: 6,7-dimethyl-8-ribityllumazine synthase [Tepidisphaeraceae bacterium]|jgi:6,7-dimethyl-8-ribityllumazine synthase
MSTEVPTQQERRIPKSTRIAVIAARFNSDIVDELLRGCVHRLTEIGLPASRIAVHHVPGAFELPVAAKVLAKRKKFSAIICLGAVIRGETPHFDFVAGEAARGIAQVAIKHTLPVIFGVLTTDTREQAQARAGGSHGHAGIRAADAAVEMIEFMARIKH